MNGKENTWVVAKNRMDKGKGYRYERFEKMGTLPHGFHPLSPKEMLRRGVFEGKYMTDCQNEFPASWFKEAKMVATGAPPNISLNQYKVKARQSLSVWQQKGWILPPDNRGWFQWYCRYYSGRRIPDVDAIQIARWRSFRSRHLGQLCSHLQKGWKTDKERQALLQWGVDTNTITATSCSSL